MVEAIIGSAKLMEQCSFISSKMGIPVSEYLRERCVPTNMAIKEIALQVPDRARAQPRFCVEEIFHWPRA